MTRLILLSLTLMLGCELIQASEANLTVDDKTLTITQDQWTDKGEIEIPRVYASLRDSHWSGNESAKVTVHPETQSWVVRWDKHPEGSKSIVLHFDQKVKSPSPIEQAGDGTITMRADQAEVHGELIRFEPQPHKNTVGYWAKAGDYAHWVIDVDQPYTFNVGALQGCGKDQGGSVATIEVERDGEVISSLEFNVEETGHFQNFVWRNVGELTIADPGRYRVTVRAKQIANKAVGDFRMLHLSPKR
ncbi:hypothetical protein Pla22_30160 [Rubripirellula amarantea]|uniref:Uncharacterized protein n=1 Tax=Rubripirellula amarantea TaxID=2527999 RepID=A0A5C5WJH9_9BACT|nr:hypothetical protein [Rubripirellula amarantea]TWT50275.1 hypothetical protein Pla22_30160 [Rubripirellula amarantea]